MSTTNLSNDTAEIHNVFVSRKPVLADKLFEDIADIPIIPGLGSNYEAFVVKLHRRMLVVDNVVAIFRDSAGDRTFHSLEFIGAAVVIETNPLIMEVCPLHKDGLIVQLPDVVTLFAVSQLFGFNMYGIKAVLEILGSEIGKVTNSPKGVQLPNLPGLISTGLSSPAVAFPPPSVPLSDNTYKARKNAFEVQPMKVLFRNNAKAFETLCGPMEDLGGDSVISVVQASVPESFLKFIALQGPNIHTVMRLRFQLASEVKEGKCLTLTHFRAPTTVVSTFYHVKSLFENFVKVLTAIVPNEDGFLDGIFADTLKLLNSSEEESLSKLDYTVVLHELNQRLVNFGTVLSSSSALSDSEQVIVYRLKESLAIDCSAVFLKSLHKGYKKLTAATAQLSGKRAREDGSSSDGRGKLGGGQNKGAGTGLCIAQVCYVCLGAGKVFDGRPPLKPCAFQSKCRYSHDIPSTPVTPSQKAEVIKLLALMSAGPQRRAELQKVTQLPTFGG